MFGNGILIKPKAPNNLQDEIPPSFATNGRRINSKHNLSMSFFDLFLTKIQDFFLISSEMSTNVVDLADSAKNKKSTKPIRTVSKS